MGHRKQLGWFCVYLFTYEIRFLAAVSQVVIVGLIILSLIFLTPREWCNCEPIIRTRNYLQKLSRPQLFWFVCVNCSCRHSSVMLFLYSELFCCRTKWLWAVGLSGGVWQASKWKVGSTCVAWRVLLQWNASGQRYVSYSIVLYKWKRVFVSFFPVYMLGKL